MHANRRALQAIVEPAIRAAAATARDRQLEASLFSLDDVACGAGITPPDIPDFPLEQRLDDERELLGVYLSGHPLDRIPRAFLDASTTSAAEITETADDEKVRIIGLVADVRRRVTQRGGMMAYVTLEDTTGRVAVTIFSTLLPSVDAFLVEQQAICVTGRVSVRDTGASPEDGERSAEIIAESITPVELGGNNGSGGTSLHIRIDSGHSHVLRLLRATIESHPGDHPVYLHVCEGDGSRRVKSGLSVDLADSTQAALQRLVGRQAVWIE